VFRAAALEKRLGYRFSSQALLSQALTHRSYGAEHNERLEFLGDGVLGCAVAELLYARFPELSEGVLTRLRATLVREEALAEVAERLQMKDFLRVGSSPVMPSILADALEALFGAVFLDGGNDAVRKSIERAFASLLERIDPQRVAKDAKTELQELLQARGQPPPRYRVAAEQGPAHQKSFEVECSIAEPLLAARGSGSSRQRAEQQAAAAMLEKLAK